MTLACNEQPCDNNYATPPNYTAPSVLPVLDQGRCGGCYALVASQVYGSRLWRWMAALGKSLTRFSSVQWLLSCGGASVRAACAQDGKDCGGGCDGGYAVMMFDYMAQRGAATSSADGASGCVPFASADGSVPQCAAYEVPGMSGEACCQGGLQEVTKQSFFARESFEFCANDWRGPLIEPLGRGHCFSYNSVGWTPFMQYNIRREIHLNGGVSSTLLVCESLHVAFSNGTKNDRPYDPATPYTAAAPGANTSAADDSAVIGYHEVQLVGWGTDTSAVPHVPYWLVKNSFAIWEFSRKAGHA